MRSQISKRVSVFVWLAEPLLCAGVRATVENSPLLQVVDNPRSGGGDVPVVITDWETALLMTRRDDRADIHPLLPESRILAISAQARECAVASALRMGVHGVILSRCTSDELVTAVRALARGSTYVCPEVAQRLVADFSRDELTAREEEVLKLLARGQCNKTIARHLEIAVSTVKTHVRGVMAKLEASSRTEAARIAAEKGVLDIPEFLAQRMEMYAASSTNSTLPAQVGLPAGFSSVDSSMLSTTEQAT